MKIILLMLLLNAKTGEYIQFPTPTGDEFDTLQACSESPKMKAPNYTDKDGHVRIYTCGVPPELMPKEQLVIPDDATRATT